MKVQKGVAEKRLRPISSFYQFRNRHLVEEWRFLLFTVSVIVYPKIWNVKVIGIATPPFGWCGGTAFFRLATPALAGKPILQNSTGLVNQNTMQRQRRKQLQKNEGAGDIISSPLVSSFL